MSADAKRTIGQAIDQTMNAIGALDKREQQIVISTVCALLGIAQSAALGGGGAGAAHAPSQQRTPAAPPPPPASDGTDASIGPAAAAAPEQPRGTNGAVERGIDIRALKAQKQPVNSQQMACIAAYYLLEHAPAEERTKEITSADLERLFKQAGYKLSARMSQILPDAKISGYFESADRGKYKLTRVGYNLVTHSLPKGTAV